MSKWVTGKLPDDEVTVLARLKDSEYPVWPCFHEDEEWHSCDGSTVEGPVLGWMHLDVAAKVLDGGKL